jgi:hypothetical protein
MLRGGGVAATMRAGTRGTRGTVPGSAVAPAAISVPRNGLRQFPRFLRTGLDTVRFCGKMRLSGE